MEERHPIDTAAMVSFFVSGTLATCFGLFSILGTLVGLAMTGLFVVTGEEEAIVGLFVLVFYGMWTVVCLAVGTLHLWSGYSLATNKPKGTWMWVAAAGGLALAITVYCAPFGMISGALAVASMVTAPPED